MQYSAAAADGTFGYRANRAARTLDSPFFLPQYGGGRVPDNDAQPLHEEQSQQQ